VKRSAVLGIALLGALGAPPAGAQQAGKTYRVGILTARTPASEHRNVDAFRRAMSSLGYREGTNLEILYRFSEGNLRRLPELAADLVRAKPDAIVASASPAIAATQRATMSVPIVMVEASDPVGSGFVASLARPGGNITGTTNMNTELNGKRLQLLKELVPRLRRVAVIRNPTNPGNLTQWRMAASAARALRIQVLAVDIHSPDQIDAALQTLPRLRVDAILVSADPVIFGNATRIVRLVAAQRLPAAYEEAGFMADGGLMFYGVSEVAIWSQAAT